MTGVHLHQIGPALLLAYVQGVLGAALGVAMGPFVTRGVPDGVDLLGLAMMLLASLTFALEVALFLFVVLVPAALVTLPLTYSAARWLTLPRWAATLLGIAFAFGIIFPLCSVTMGGGWTFPGEFSVFATLLGGACLAQPIWRRCMRPRLAAAAPTSQ